MQVKTFKPESWDEVQPYDLVAYNAETNPERKPRMRYIRPTSITRHRDVHAVEYNIVSLSGDMCTKSGELHRGYSNRYEAHKYVRLSQVVSVTGRREDEPEAETPAPAVEAPKAEMSETQQTTILRAQNNAGTEAAGTAVYWARGYVHVVERTAKVLLREGWVTGTLGYGPYPVTAAGLIAAGVDMGAIYDEATKEDGDRNAREFDRVQRVYNASHLRGEAGRVYDSKKAHTLALEEYAERAKDEDWGWGQPDGMFGNTQAELMAAEQAAAPRVANPYNPVASPRAYDYADQLLRADLTAVRADGVALPIVPPAFPEGTPEHAAYAAELRTELAKFTNGEKPYPYPAATPTPGEAALRAAAELRSMINGETISDNVLRRALREQLRRLDSALSTILS